MYLIVVGAGPIGVAFLEQVLERGHDAVLIEPDATLAERMAARFDIRVLHASIADGSIADEAGFDRADAVVATTNDDAANLMATFLGREKQVATLVSIVNDAEHRGLFERIDTHVLLDPEEIVARHLYDMLRRPDEVEASGPRT